MRRIALLLVTAVMILGTAFAFAGCGEVEPKTLEEYVSDSPSAREEIENTVNALGNDDVTMAVDFERNNILVTGTMQTTYAEDLLDIIENECADRGKEIEGQATELITQLEEVTGSDDVTIEVVMNNGDGKEIWRRSYGN